MEVFIEVIFLVSLFGVMVLLSLWADAMSKSIAKPPTIDPLDIEALDDLLYAWRVAGPHPEIHQQEKDRLKKNWPRLYHAIEEIMDANDW